MGERAPGRTPQRILQGDRKALRAVLGVLRRSASSGFIRFLFLGRTAGGSQDGRGGASGADRYERQGAVEGRLRSDRRAFVVRRSTYEASGDTGARRANPKSMRRSEAALR